MAEDTVAADDARNGVAIGASFDLVSYGRCKVLLQFCLSCEAHSAASIRRSGAQRSGTYAASMRGNLGGHFDTPAMRAISASAVSLAQ